MPRQRVQQRLVLDVVRVAVPVVARRVQRLAVGRERHAPHRRRVALQTIAGTHAEAGRRRRRYRPRRQARDASAVARHSHRLHERRVRSIGSIVVSAMRARVCVARQRQRALRAGAIRRYVVQLDASRAPPATAKRVRRPLRVGDEGDVPVLRGGARDHNLGLVRGDVPDADLRVKAELATVDPSGDPFRERRPESGLFSFYFYFYRGGFVRVVRRAIATRRARSCARACTRTRRRRR